ncbi:MAG: 50S ribosomal protein L17 [Dehalococcoidia bacterium]|nr:50S ribosomal protein L17 [Chloroflexota bacterium]MCH2525815.1 50S ribosomal protein L17 [Dehalococcoidia bacterium]MQF99589.1 50S ribosomal protein L17 [SAR202 cluster bacterium]
MSGRKLSRPTSQRILMYRSMVTDLLRHERIRTTEAKAKEIRGLAEKMITLGKKGSLSHRRQAIGFITDESVVRKVFDDLAERYADRDGGYTRVIKMEPRKGDGASMALLELV